MLPTAKHAVRCRSIVESDLQAVSELLSQGFTRRTTDYWLKALRRLSSHPTPDGYERYGYVLDVAGEPVGALLVISSQTGEDAGQVRCNVSSWYVRPDYRSYGPLLSSRAGRHGSAVYINIDPARPTWPIIEAQGFRKFSDGAFAALPALSLRSERAKVSRFIAAEHETSLDPHEQRILSDHDGYGCISLRVQAEDGDHPFVFRKRRFRLPVPCAELVYCRGHDEVVRFAGPLGRFLALRGMPWVLVCASRPLPLPGVFFPDKLPLYGKGPALPRLGDLAYTEVAVFGL